MPRDWDAATYDRVSAPQTRWGRGVVDRLPLAGDERVLDAGCGTGRVTAMLLERLPRGQVVALDGSPAMIDETRRRFAGDARVTPVVADLAQPLPLEAPVDAVLSTATFHWILDHAALFRHLAAAVRPGGRLVAQCGGVGNIARVTAAVKAVDPAIRQAKNYATPEETTARLTAAGFTDVQVWLHPEPTRFEPGEPLETFLRTVILGDVLPGMPEARRDAFVHDVAARMEVPEIDYVRLNIDARRA
ncbi:MAG TPA: methyltransferase domain-containing protein [Polyangia bacterium]|nr:methyltransferase domain-containing protein [Polyangia bacterium]